MQNPIYLERIKNRRKELKITQLEMSQKLGFKSPSTYYKYESGEYTLKVDTLQQISKILKVDYSYFFKHKSSEIEQNAEI
ncbi:helix-turn-helix domain-containing protein [Lentilactobacillus kosonis]|uniref:HTH cro/C1-type domain-containing protein n=1 Tax=Lentilactobacillus kosonis TaxID=2810561 RepID=A0A401FPE0_9LACO|nr:helix-turn-helix transcriptional regulator [Lentilactobacillus kosonis]GAY74232.1 hypothetical protein NBRC111893_2378 [Lentilactobacillus kosonis]